MQHGMRTNKVVLNVEMFPRPQDQKTVTFLLLAWGKPQFLANNELVNLIRMCFEVSSDLPLLCFLTFCLQIILSNTLNNFRSTVLL